MQWAPMASEAAIEAAYGRVREAVAKRKASGQPDEPETEDLIDKPARD